MSKFFFVKCQRSLEHYTENDLPTHSDSLSRLTIAKHHKGFTWFGRKEYQNLHKGLSQATASRDLLYGVRDNILMKKGAHNQTHYCFVEKEDKE